MAKKAFKMGAEHFEAVARLFDVLADPTRLSILYLLKQRPCYVQEIVDSTGLKQSNVSKHLAVLYDAGLVARERNGNQIRCSIRDSVIFDLCDLVCDKLRREAESHAQMMRRVAG
jgi:DNA-binding transcriptional ArsR family regulator